MASERASAVSPEMTMPMCSSTRKTFFWKEASSNGERLRPAMTANLSETSPTDALPWLTASIAYSTWKRRPFGLNVVTSVSYSERFIARDGARAVARRRSGARGLLDASAAADDVGNLRAGARCGRGVS